MAAARTSRPFWQTTTLEDMTPQQWDRIRLRCSVAVSALSILIEASLPKPVLMP